LDAVDSGATPGTVSEWPGEEIHLRGGIKLSEHQVTLEEVLGLARVRGRLPIRLHLIGMQPACLEIGCVLSPAVAAALHEMLERAETVLRGWLNAARTAELSHREAIIGSV
jgi:hydrogenase maturation protease